MRVPNYQSGQVSPVEITNARFRPADNGGGIGAALAGGLKVGAEFADDMAKGYAAKIDLQNETESRERALRFQDGAAEVIAQAKQARGIDVPAAFKRAEEDLLKLQERQVAEASNPRVANLSKARIEPYLTAFRVDMANHEASEIRAAADDTLKAQANNATTQAVANFINPAISQAHIDTGRAAVADRAKLLGLTPEATSNALAEYESDARKSVYDNRVAEGDIDGAIAYHDAYRDRFTAEDLTATAASLRKVQEKRQAFSDKEAALGAGIPASDLPTGGKFTMPVTGGRVTSPYGAARPGHMHNGVDWAAPQGTGVRPMAPGKVVAVSQDARSGKFVVVDHGDGTTTSYSHLGKQDVQVGQSVDSSTVLGPVGLTGHTTGPHVHVVARKHGKPIDPVSLLGAKSAGGGGTSDGGPRRDQRAAHAWIDQQDWSFERKEMAKDALDADFSERDRIDAREEREADKAAAEQVFNLGDRFTSLEQIPANLRTNMSVAALDRLDGAAQRNAAGKQPKANGADYLYLSGVRQGHPEAFVDMDLGEWVGKVTQGELVQMNKDQQALRRQGRDGVELSKSIESTISTFALPELKISGAGLDRGDRIRVHDSMAAYLRQVTGGKRQPTAGELREALGTATRNVTVRTPGMLWGENVQSKRRYDVTIDEVPADLRKQAEAALRDAGREVTDDAVVSLYLQLGMRGSAMKR